MQLYLLIKIVRLVFVTELFHLHRTWKFFYIEHDRFLHNLNSFL